MKPIRKEAGELFDIHAHEYHEWMKTINTYDSTLDIFCDNIENSDANILDLACGPGNITGYLIEKQPDFKISGIDLAPKMITIAQNRFPQATFKVMDCRNVNQLSQKFDGIVCGFGLPYLSKKEALQLIDDTSKRLTPKGILYLSTMEDEYSKSKIETSSSGKYETQMYYHEGIYLKQTMLDFGFEIVLEERLKSINKKGEEVIDLVLIGQKG